MKNHNLKSIILLALLALVTLLVLFLPVEGNIYIYILRGIVFVIIVWLLLFLKAGRKEDEEIRQGKAAVPVESAGYKTQQIRIDMQEQYDELLDSILDITRSINPEYKVAVYMVDPASKGFTLQKGATNFFSDFIPGDNKIVGSIMKQKKAIVLQQKDVREGWKPLFREQTWRGSECLLGVPIVYKESPVGCILMQIDHFSKILDHDRDILSSLGGIFTLGMMKIEEIEKLLTDSYYNARIANLFEIIDISSDENKVFDMVKGLCRTFFSYDKLTISMLDSSPTQAKIKLVDGLKDDIDTGEVFSIQSTLHGRPIREGRLIRSSYWEQSYSDAGRFKEGDNRSYNFMSILAVPLKVNGNVKGAIAIERLHSHPFTDTDQHLLELLGTTVGSILTWIYEYRRMHSSAIHDGLTGLLNHRAFMERFEEEISRALRFQQKLVLVVLDLDKFKRINDTYGHIYGDYMLKIIADIIKNSVRNIDVVARYGGEEFVVILVNTNKENSLPIAERITENIAEYQFDLDGVKTRMTISAGMAEFPMDADQVKSLIEKADIAMYKQKERGGNGVSVFPV